MTPNSRSREYQDSRHLADGGYAPEAATLADGRWPALAGIFAGTVFALDLFTPVGVGLSALYPVAVLLCLRAPHPGMALVTAAAASLLTVISTLLAPHGTDVAPFVEMGVILAVIWIAAWFVYRYVALTRADLERSLKRLGDFKYAIDQSSIVAVTDARGVIRDVNDRFCEISKYRRDELIGQDHRLVNSAYHPKAYIRDLWRTISSGHVWHGELRNQAKDGSFYWLDTTIVPLLDERGRPYQYMAIRYDITERKRSEALLREQAALARLGEMAAVVAHEVKNPLAGIRGALQIIGSRMPAESRDRLVMGDVLTRLDSLNEMVQDLLLFARPRTPRKTRVELGPLVAATAALLRRDPAAAGLRVTVTGGDATVDADPELLQIVVQNLLVNAAQAMQGTGTVQVHVTCGEASCELRFIDEGPGMPAEVRERMFEPFFTTKHRGTGLGLPTARRLVELHGGEIEAACPPGGGTVVTVMLPAGHPAEHPAPDPALA